MTRLQELAWALVRAQGRMLDKWSDGDEAVKNDLWKALHKAGDELREHLSASPSDSHAGQESIEFSKWLSENYYLDGEGFYHHDYQNKTHFTIGQLYAIFKTTKK